MTGLRERHRRLLRWYPAAWRATNEAVMLDTLDELAEARGQRRPSVGDAWSIRAHGAIERLTPRAAMVLAASSLIAQATLALGWIALSSALLSGDGAAWLDGEGRRLGAIAAGLMSGLVVVPTLALAGAALLRATRPIPVAPLVLALGGATLASAASGLASAWAVDPATGGPHVGWTVAPLALCLVATVPAMHAWLGGARSIPAWTGAVLLSALVAGVLLGVGGVAQAAVGAAVLLAAIARARRDGDPVRSETAPTRPWSPVAVGALALATVALTMPGVVLATLASVVDGIDQRAVEDVALPVAWLGMLGVVVAGALPLARRLGLRAWLVAAAWGVAAAMGALGRVEASGDDVASLLVGMLVGVGVGLLVGWELPGGEAVRSIAGIAAALVVGFLAAPAVQVLPYVAIVAGVALCIAAIVRGMRDSVARGAAARLDVG